MLKKIEENHKFLSFFDNHQMLLGILLGYGKHNAQLFDKSNQISPFVYRKEFPEIPVKIPNPHLKASLHWMRNLILTFLY